MKTEQHLKVSNDLGTGLLKYTSDPTAPSGTISIAVPDVDYATSAQLDTLVAEAQASADQALSSATTAQSAASDASTASSDAMNAATSAQDSATASQGSADTASGSASEAQSASMQAQASATAAENSATAAGSSMAGAEVSATSASSSASDAATSASSAGDSATSASDSATSAQDSATIAQGAASDASTAASDVTNLVDQAQTYAASAQESATQAQESADSASGSATTAQDSATSAESAAAEAQMAVSSLTGVSGASFVLGQANANLPNAQVLGSLGEGLLKNDSNGTLSKAEAGVDYASPTILGNLSVNDTTLTSSANKDIILSPHGTGMSKVIGALRQKGIVSGYTGSDIIRGQAALQTNNNTATTILSFALPLSNPATAIVCRASVAAISVTGTASAAAFDMGLAGAYYNGTSVVALGSLPAATSRKTPSTFVALAAWSVVGSNLVLRVTGVTAQSINWVCSYEVFAVTTSTS